MQPRGLWLALIGGPLAVIALSGAGEADATMTVSASVTVAHAAGTADGQSDDGSDKTSDGASTNGAAGPTGPSGPEQSGQPLPEDIPLAAPAPVLGQTVAAAPAEGAVSVLEPGKSNFQPLSAASTLPVGSIIDASRGTVVLASARDAHGHVQQAAFGASAFEVRQRGDGMTDILLRGGSFSQCLSAGAPRAHIALSGVEQPLAFGGRAQPRRPVAHPRHVLAHRVVRRLWARDHGGRFRTFGRGAVATVRGTSWVTLDRCDGTLTVVKRGRVAVTDLARHRTVLVRAGQRYLAVVHRTSHPVRPTRRPRARAAGDLPLSVPPLPGSNIRL